MLAKILKPFLPKVKEMVTDQQLLEIYDSYVDAKSKEEEKQGAIMLFKQDGKVKSCVINVTEDGRISGWRKMQNIKEFLLNLLEKL